MKNYNNLLIKKFEKYMIIKNYSRLSIEGYIYNIKIFFEYIIEYYSWNMPLKDINIFQISQIKSSVFVSFLGYLKYEKKINIITINRYVAALNCFFNWVYNIYRSKTLHGKENPMLFLKNNYRIKTFKLPKYIDLENAK